jgi:hypothetical protein
LEDDEGLTMPNYDPKDNFFLQLVHVALKIRGDLIGIDGHVGPSVSEDDAINCKKSTDEVGVQIDIRH